MCVTSRGFQSLGCNITPSLLWGWLCCAVSGKKLLNTTGNVKQHFYDHLIKYYRKKPCWEKELAIPQIPRNCQTWETSIHPKNQRKESKLNKETLTSQL